MFRFHRTHYFIPPKPLELEGFNYLPNKYRSTYSKYNYLNPGLGSLLRRQHFEYALRAAKQYFQTCDVIDFGCADGVFLPSLDKYFSHVVGIDIEPSFIELASIVVRSSNLTAVTLICNKNLTIEDLKSQLKNNKYKILFLLETIEHVGDKNDLWYSKIKFINELFTLLEPDGLIVISVPKMVGIPFLLQRIGLFLLNSERENISLHNLIRASMFNDTSSLEKSWQSWQMGKIGHLGFNHVELGKLVKERFNLIKEQDLLFQKIYIIQKKYNNN